MHLRRTASTLLGTPIATAAAGLLAHILVALIAGDTLVTCVLFVGDLAFATAAWLVRSALIRRDRARIRERFDWSTRLRRALSEDGFELYAQPIVDLASGRTCAHELLLR
jgi:sensor c-di-GMP phosphodiesterase-like protein